MKKNVNSTESSVALINEEQLKNKIYTIREVKVMLDADLAEIYGYETRFFNRQVKNNEERFASDFRFQLRENEYANLMCKKCTSSWGGVRKMPYAFTEQGIYMLMTVLKGELAIKQSIALIRLFKQMKDYIITEGSTHPNCASCAQIAAITAQHSQQIADIRTDVMNLTNDTLSLKKESHEHGDTLAKIMDYFVDPSAFKHFLILNGQRLEADLAYTQIYSMAKETILIVDNYVGVKTLDLLRGVAAGVKVTILGNQRGSNAITQQIVNDFKTARPDVELTLKTATNKFHDRYILLDSGRPREKPFHCGASSKDAGGRITTIMEIENAEMYHGVF